MHEHSIARRLVRLAESICDERELYDVTSISIEVGALSGIEAELLESAFAAERRDTRMSNATMKITVIPVTGVCNACDTEQPINDFNFRCSSCERPLRVTQGEKLELVSITAKQTTQLNTK